MSDYIINSYVPTNDDDYDEDDASCNTFENEEQYKLNNFFLKSNQNRRKQIKPIRISNQEKKSPGETTTTTTPRKLEPDNFNNKSDVNNNNDSKSESLKRKISQQNINTISNKRVKLNQNDSEKQEDKTNFSEKSSETIDRDYDYDDIAQNEEATRAMNKNINSSNNLLAINDQNDQMMRHMSSSAAIKSNYHNMDTFCNICKKELCNKYFLKTHLLNKHGIVLQNDDNLSVSTASLPTVNMSQNQLQCSPSSKMQFNTKSSSSPINGDNIENEGYTGNRYDEINEIEQSGGSNNQIEDFCELCQKQFCNKYYLKKHKLDVHGVLIDNGIKSYKRISSETTLNPAFLNNSNSNSNCSNNSDNKAIMQQVANSNLPALMLMNPFLNPMMHFNHPMLTPEASAAAAAAAVASLIQPDDDQAAVENGTASEIDSQTAQILMSQMNHHLHQQTSKASPSPTPVNSAISNILNDNKSNKKLIETNTCKTAEVMCDLCTKLFYNEEYLAFHKLNKHGVPLPMEQALEHNGPMTSSILKSIKNEPEQQPQKCSDKENLEDLSTRNLLLVNALYAKELGVKLSADTQAAAAAIMASNSSESYCEYCNKSFCNKYFLKTHMLKSHGKLMNMNGKRDYDSMDNESANEYLMMMATQQQQQQQQQQQLSPREQPHDDYSNDSTVVENNNSSFMNGVLDTNFAAKIADRVICDICNKQVCNKYFLKTHKQKVHGIQMNNSTNDYYEDNTSNVSVDSDFIDINNAPLKVEINGDVDDLHLQNVSQNNKNRSNSTSTTSNSISPQSSLASSQIQLQASSSSQQQQQPQALISRDSYCDLCKRQFCSKYFLRNHMINMHGINQSKFNYNKAQGNSVQVAATSPQHKSSEKENDGLKSKVARLPIEPQQQIQSPLSSVSSKLSFNNINSTSATTNSINCTTRVICVICNKDLCNKYFLKQHLINVHKTTFEEYCEKFDLTKADDSSNSATTTDENSKSKNLKYFIAASSKHENNATKRKRHYSESSELSSTASSINSANDESAGDEQQKNTTNNTIVLADKNGNFIKKKQLEMTTSQQPSDDDIDMQPFLLESNDDAFSSNFMPCMVYLPVKLKLNKPVNINLTLKPIKKTGYNKQQQQQQQQPQQQQQQSSKSPFMSQELPALNDNINEQHQIEIM